MLLAQTVKAVVANVVVGVPEITPVVLFRESPAGMLGVTSQLVMSPPEVMGVRDTTLRLTVKFSVDTSYARAIARSSKSSSASQIPSLSLSAGVLESSSESVPHADSSASDQPSSSSSGSVVSGTPSPSVSSSTVMLTVAKLVCPPLALAQTV